MGWIWLDRKNHDKYELHMGWIPQNQCQNHEKMIKDDKHDDFTAISRPFHGDFMVYLDG